MFKVYKLISSNSKYPLAEIRTDGKSIDVFTDNTNGKLTQKVKTLQQLLRYVKNSSILKLIEDSSPTVNLLRYVLDNGDVVEITTDGHTAILNGRFLGQEEKNALFIAIKRGDINVSRKADPTKPIPVFPTPKVQEQAPESQVKSQITPGMLDAVQKRQSNIAKIRSLSTKSYDYEIENGDYSGAEDPGYCKEILYALRYGDSNE